VAVTVLQHRLCQGEQFVARDPAGAVGDLFEAGDLEALALFQRGDELAGFRRAVVLITSTLRMPASIKVLSE
jgi:hypothetical protein